MESREELEKKNKCIEVQYVLVRENKPYMSGPYISKTLRKGPTIRN
jgi:hypothetical protein